MQINPHDPAYPGGRCETDRRFESPPHSEGTPILLAIASEQMAGILADKERTSVLKAVLVDSRGIMDAAEINAHIAENVAELAIRYAEASSRSTTKGSLMTCKTKGNYPFSVEGGCDE